MLAFEVYVNEVKVCTMGLGDLDLMMGAVACMVPVRAKPTARKLNLALSGMGHSKPYHWMHRDLSVGDRVEFRIVDTSETDQPTILSCPGGSCAT